MAFLIHSLLCGCVTLAYLIIRKIVKVSPTVRYIFDCILFLFYAFPTMLIPKGVAGGEGIIVHDRADVMSVALMADDTVNETITQASEFTQSNVDILFNVWFTIFLVLLFYMCCKNLLYVKQVNRWRRPLEGDRIDCFAERIYICPILTTPILRGILRPSLYFPEQMAGEGDIRLIGYHEEVHYRRKDVLLKMAVTIIAVAHWFNPLVWLLYECFQKDCELSCDARAAERMTQEEKKEYLELLIRCAKKQASMSMVAAFGFNRRFLEERVEVVMGKKKKWIIGTIVLAVCVLCGIGVITCYTYERELTEEETIIKYLEDPVANSYLAIDTIINMDYVEYVEFLAMQKEPIINRSWPTVNSKEHSYTKFRIYTVAYKMKYKEGMEMYGSPWIIDENGVVTQEYILIYTKDGWRIHSHGFSGQNILEEK